MKEIKAYIKQQKLDEAIWHCTGSRDCRVSVSLPREAAVAAGGVRMPIRAIWSAKDCR